MDHDDGNLVILGLLKGIGIEIVDLPIADCGERHIGGGIVE